MDPRLAGPKEPDQPVRRWVWTLRSANAIVCPVFETESADPMALLSQIFTWWNGQTIGTRFYTWRKGSPVGTDGAGNRYYRAKDGSDRRWVIYNGAAEASRVPPEWHGWLHHTVDTPPGGPEAASGTSYVPRPWEKPHQPNLTGTPLAYRPAGSLGKSHGPAAGTPGKSTYRPWRPN